MPTYNTQYVPLDPVESAQLNRWQRVFLTQRAPGAANSLATGLDTPDTNHTPKEVVFACGNAAKRGCSTIRLNTKPEIKAPGHVSS